MPPAKTLNTNNFPIFPLFRIKQRVKAIIVACSLKPLHYFVSDRVIAIFRVIEISSPPAVVFKFRIKRTSIMIQFSQRKLIII